MKGYYSRGEFIPNKVFRPKQYGGHKKVTKFTEGCRQRVLERDGRCCQHCYTTEKLCVHHIDSSFGQHNNDLNNLITLCRKCHGLVHGNQFRKDRRRIRRVDIHKDRFAGVMYTLRYIARRNTRRMLRDKMKKELTAAV